jgi:hypothetical protein
VYRLSCVSLHCYALRAAAIGGGAALAFALLPTIDAWQRVR